jgi:two-component system OmpR family sensor kinase
LFVTNGAAVTRSRIGAGIGRLSVANWSLRARLVIGAVALAAVALTVTGTVGIALLRGYLVQQLDRQLDVGVKVTSRAAPPAANETAKPGSTPPILTPFVFADLSPSGAVTSESGSSLGASDPGPDLSGLSSGKVRSESGKAFTVSGLDGGPGYRVRVVEKSDGTGASVVAISMQSVDATVGRMEAVTWLVALGVLALLVLLATVTVRLGLRPLVSVEQAAEEIAAGDLGRRVPSGRPGTEIGRLSNAFNGMLGQIESAFEARENSELTLRRFVADASHELRTPLTTVRGYAELARKGALGDEAAQLRAMERIEDETIRMARLVDDLVLLAYLDQERPLQVETVDLAALAVDAVEDAKVRDAGRPIEYAGPSDPVLICADPDRIRQVLVNLLNNAITHTPPGTPVRVLLRTDGGTAYLEVADSGPGLEPDQVTRLFERFYRVDPFQARSRGGSGLGLAIVEAIVRASMGRVGCTSTPGAGTSFLVTLPLVGPERHS